MMIFHSYLYYTGLGNLCDLSAAVFPVTKVDPAVDVQPAPHEFRCAQDERIYNLCELSSPNLAPMACMC
jgi:amidase